jgi:23S rRNA (uracil1939-C5)-methyltransferase
MTENVTIEKLVFGGSGLARNEGRVALVPFVLPGENVEIKRVDKLSARATQIENHSPHRVEARCPYFTRCGGCHYQHASYDYQVEQKVEILREVLRRVAKIDAGEIRTIAAEAYAYRNRVQLHIEGGKLGYREAGSHRLCAIEVCPISSPRINEAIAALNRMLRDGRRFPDFLKTIELFTNEDALQINVVESDRPLARRFFDWFAGELPGVANGAIDYTASGSTFRVSTGSFFQVNRFLVEALMEEALGDFTGDRAIDLYAGVGLFSLPLSQRFRHVTAVEAGGSAFSDLQFNLSQAGLAEGGMRSAVDEYLINLDETPDFALVDPPRAGLGKQVVEQLLRLRPRRMHIVACDPATFARDLVPLLAAGYHIERLTMVDLFPQTFHLETVAWLTAS